MVWLCQHKKAKDKNYRTHAFDVKKNLKQVLKKLPLRSSA